MKSTLYAIYYTTWLCFLATTAAASSSSYSFRSLQEASAKLTKDLAQDMLDKEIRQQIIDMHEEALPLLEQQDAQEDDAWIPHDFFSNSLQYGGDNQYPHRGRRSLQETIGEWDAVNALLRNLEFNIPPVFFSTELLGFQLTVKANGTCSRIAVNDVRLDYDKGMEEDGSPNLAYIFQVLGAELTCFLNVEWDTGVLELGDKLKIKVGLNESSFGVATRITGVPPNNATFIGCKVRVNIAELASSGGFSSDIINDLNTLVVGLVRNEEGLISSVVCDLLTSATDTVNDLLVTVGDLLTGNLNPVTYDPLALENSYVPPPELVNFQDSDGFGGVINTLIGAIGDAISAETLNTLISGLLPIDEDGVLILVLDDDPFGTSPPSNVTIVTGAPSPVPTQGTGNDTASAETAGAAAEVCSIDVPLVGSIDLPSFDLDGLFRRRLTHEVRRHLAGPLKSAVKDQVRRQALRELQDIDGLQVDLDLANIIDLDNLITGFDFGLTYITVVGLNNFTDAQPIQVIGEHTFLTQLTLESLTFEVGIALDLEVNGLPLQDILTIAGGIQDLFVNTSYIVGLKEEEVNSWTLGTILNIGNLPGCIFAALETVGISQLQVEVGFIDIPTINLNLFPGVVEIGNTLVESIVCGYQDLFLLAIPNLFQNNVTTLLNDALDCYIDLFSADAVCNETDFLADFEEFENEVEFDFRRSAVRPKSVGNGRVRGFLDFRDLLLPPAESIALGGSGRQPYGDLMPLVFGQLMGQLMEPDNTTGLPGINGFFPESIDLGMSLFDFSADTSTTAFLGNLMQKLTLAAYNLRAQNLNTIVSPISVLQPTTGAHVLSNILHVGPVPGRSLNVSMTVFMELVGEDSGLAMKNELDAGIRTNEVDLSADLRIMIAARDFLMFPVRDLLEINCWLALIQDPKASNGAVLDNSFEIRSFVLDIVSLSMKLICRNCTSEVLPGAIDTLEESGAILVLGNRVGPLIDELTQSDMLPDALTGLIGFGDTAATQCPHSPLYNTTLNTSSDFEIELPMLSNKSIDTAIYAGILGAQVFAVVIAESHLVNAVNLSDPLAGQYSLDTMNATEAPDLLDMLRLNESSVPFAGDALDFLRDFVGGTSDEGVLGVNELLSDFLEEDGSLNLSLGFTVDLLEGYEITIDSVQLLGLNSFRKFDILKPIAPQTLQNSFEMDNITVSLDFSIFVANVSDIPQSYKVTFGVDDVNATIYAFAGIDMDKVGSLELGSLLFIQNILSCGLSSAYDFHIPAMRVTIGNFTDVNVEGLLPDTSEAARASFEAIFKDFGSVLVEATNSIFDTTVRGIVNDFVASFITDISPCQSAAELSNISLSSTAFIDFRDLLLPPDSAKTLGGSGTQPYGDVVSTVYAFVLDLLSSSEDEELSEINSFVDSFTESQSGSKGMIRLQDELFNFVVDSNILGLDERIELSAFDAQVGNLNTLVSPLSIAFPTTNPHVIENMVNLGPVAGKPISAALGILLAIAGDLSSLDMFNKFNINGTIGDIDLVAAINLLVLKDNLFRFPLRDIFEIGCWLSLFETRDQATNISGFKIESMLTTLSSLSIEAQCLNCTSRVLSEAINLVDEAGASATFGNRLGFLLEDVATSDAASTLLNQFGFGEDAGRSCPHHPLFNTTEIASESPPLALPGLSRMSLDTILFASMVFAEVAVVIGADSHLQNTIVETDPMASQKALEVPEGANLLDWTDPGASGVPFIGTALDLIRSLLGNGDSPNGNGDPSINSVVSELLDESGSFAFELGLPFELLDGFVVQINGVRAHGLNTFTQFDVLNPLAEQTFANNISLDSLKLQLDVSVDSLESPDEPNHLNVTFNMASIDVFVPVFVAVDKDLLGNLKLGSLLHLSNLLPCMLSTTYGFQLEELLVSVGNLSEPVFEGFLPETSEALANATTAIFGEFGNMIEESIPLVFQNTIRVLANSYLASFGESDCKDYSTETDSRFIDFRQLFLGPANASNFNPYGDIIPLVRDFLLETFLEVNPETQMPKINDEIIAPLTEGQSGTAGRIEFPGQLVEFNTDALAGIGVKELGFEISEANMNNLNTVGEPFKILEPNMTRGDLLDNSATFGTQLQPLRFSIRLGLSVMGSFINTEDQLEIFGELRSANILAVLLARFGAPEVLGFPLQHTSNADCWLATLAEPALDAIEAGKTDPDPILSIHYLNMAFSEMRLSANCYNCTTSGLEVVPELLEILETTTAKNVLGYRNVELLLNLINSDFVQVWLLRFFQDSMKSCPFTENATSVSTQVSNPAFPSLSSYDMETGVFTVTVIIQLGLVIMASTIADLEGIGPLIPDPEPEIDPGTRLVDFTAMDTYPNGALALTMIEFMNDFLGSPDVDPDTGEISLPISSILGNPAIPFELDTFDLPLDLDIGINELKIGIKGAKISGIDTFTKLAFANITGPTTLEHKVGWQRLQVDIALEIRFTDDTDPELRRRLQPKQDESVFSFDLNLELTDVGVVAETFVALDYDRLKYIELGHFLRLSQLFPCIQATILHLEFTKAALEIGRVTKMQVSGFKSDDTAKAAENLEETLLELYGDKIASMAPTVFSAALRPLLNTVVNNYLRESDFDCNEFPFDPSTGGFVDFRDLFLEPSEAIEYGGTGLAQYGDLFSTIYTYSKIVVALFVLDFFEDISIPGPLINYGLKFYVSEFQAVIVLKLSELSIVGLDGLRRYTYTEPVMGEAFLLNNSGKLASGRTPFRVKVRVYFNLKGLGNIDDVDIRNDVEISFDMKMVDLVLTLLSKIREESFVRFPLRDALDLNCWLATIPPPELDENGSRVLGSEPTLSVEDLIFQMQELNIDLNCLNCTSPGVLEMDEKLALPGASEQLTEQANSVLKTVIKAFGGDLLQDIIDGLLVDAPKHCKHTDNYDPNAPPFNANVSAVEPTDPMSYIYYTIAILVPLCLAVLAMISLSCHVRKRNEKWLAGLPSERVFLIQQKQEKEDHMETELNEITKSMFESEQVPWIARYMVPFIVIVNIGFFLSGHLNLGAEAFLDFSLFGETFTINEFYEFSIAKSTLDMWYAGGEELALIILLFSGIWPYTKQLITLALWFLPPSVVSVTRRGKFLLWLDILAKWSMIDIFSLLIVMIGFRLGGATPGLLWLPENFIEINLVVVPKWGLYANLLAQMMSQISSHFIVMYHRRIIKRGREIYDARHRNSGKPTGIVEQADVGELLSSSLPADDTKDQLFKYSFRRPHKEGGAKLIVRRAMKFILPFGAALLCVLLMFCLYLPTFKLESQGLIGLLIEMSSLWSKPAVQEESVFSMAVIIIEQAIYLDDFKQYLGHGFLAFVFIVTLAVIPIAVLCTLMYIWLIPQTRERREKAAIALEILQAWQYVEVYMLGIIICSWQLGAISKLFINRYCEEIQPLFDTMVSYGIFDAKDAQCFELEASILEGAYLLIPFVIGLALVTSYVMKAYCQYLREKRDDEEEVLEEEKLRAFDRTTWDSREAALENIRPPPCQFTDTYRWTLCKESSILDMSTTGDATKMELAATYGGAETSSSDNDDESLVKKLEEIDSNEKHEEAQRYIGATSSSSDNEDAKVEPVRVEETVALDAITPHQPDEKFVFDT